LKESIILEFIGQFVFVKEIKHVPFPFLIGNLCDITATIVLVYHPHFVGHNMEMNLLCDTIDR